jgi:integrase
MRRICKEADVKHFGFHAIRHLTASILYHQGEHLAHIQTILRHRKSTTTEHYLRRIGLERVRDALESLSPKTTDAEVIAFDKAFGSEQSGSGK